MHPRKKEFIELFEASGWTQAEAARQLGISRGGVNGIVTGETIPSEITMRLFRLIMISEKPEVIGAKETAKIRADLGEDWAGELMDELRRIEPDQREHLVAALKEVARAFPKPEVRYRPKREKNDNQNT